MLLFRFTSMPNIEPIYFPDEYTFYDRQKLDIIS